MQLFFDNLFTILETLRLNSGATNAELTSYFMLVCGISAAVYIGFFVMKAFAVCIMAKNRAIKHWWLGMIPFANFAIIGKLAGPVRIFRIDVKNIGIITACALFVSYAASTFFVVALYGDYVVKLLGNALPVGEYVISISKTSALYSVLNIVNYVGYFIELVYIFSYIALVFSFFRKYAPAKSFLFSVLSIIEPLFSILLIVVRNNKPQSYDDYIKEQYAKRYGQSYNPYSNPYSTKDNPFGDAQKITNPFDEFADPKKTDDSPAAKNENSSDNGQNGNPFDEYTDNKK